MGFPPVSEAPRVTLKTIASEAGVSAACVSKALNGRGRISAERTARIKAIAARLGYRPDPLMASLAAHRFRRNQAEQGIPLALLEFPVGFRPGPPTKTGDRIYRRQLLLVAEKLGYAPKVYTPPEDGNYHALARMLYHRGVRAIVASGRIDPRFFHSPADWEHFAMVQCGRAADDSPIHTVRADIAHAINLSFRVVRERGYRRIGFAPGSHPDGGLMDDRARLGAILALLEKEVDPADRVPPFTDVIFRDEGREQALLVAWARRHRPDAYIAFSRAMHWWLRYGGGIDCPRDGGFVSLHASKRQNADGYVRASGVDQRLDEIARQAILMADQMVRHGEHGLAGDEARQVLVRGKWIEGDTLPDLRQPKKTA